LEILKNTVVVGVGREEVIRTIDRYRSRIRQRLSTEPIRFIFRSTFRRAPRGLSKTASDTRIAEKNSFVTRETAEWRSLSESTDFKDA